MNNSALRASGPRFGFGQNWQSYAKVIDDCRIQEARASLRDMLAVERLTGKTFLDIGCGSGLFSLAARELGATVHSFDVDADSVQCTKDLRERYGFGEDSGWVVEHGSILDHAYLSTLGTHFDVVYAWGVLHHTGALWDACQNVAGLVASGGLLFLAIYNDQGRPSRGWWWVKYSYNRAPTPMRLVLLAGSYLWMYQIKRLPLLVTSLARGRLPERVPAPERGMSAWHDLVDWVGGYPFEVARPGQVFDFFCARGLALRRLVTRSGHGNNEFVFERVAPAGDFGAALRPPPTAG